MLKCWYCNITNWTFLFFRIWQMCSYFSKVVSLALDHAGKRMSSPATVQIVDVLRRARMCSVLHYSIDIWAQKLCKTFVSSTPGVQVFIFCQKWQHPKISAYMKIQIMSPRWSWWNNPVFMTPEKLKKHPSFVFFNFSAPHIFFCSSVLFYFPFLCFHLAFYFDVISC